MSIRARSSECLFPTNNPSLACPSKSQEPGAKHRPSPLTEGETLTRFWAGRTLQAPQEELSARDRLQWRHGRATKAVCRRPHSPSPSQERAYFLCEETEAGSAAVEGCLQQEVAHGALPRADQRCAEPTVGRALTSVLSAFSEANKDVVHFHFFFSKLQQR